MTIVVAVDEPDDVADRTCTSRSLSPDPIVIVTSGVPEAESCARMGATPGRDMAEASAARPSRSGRRDGMG